MQKSQWNFDGYYMVNNLGKLTAAPQVRYISNLYGRMEQPMTVIIILTKMDKMVTETGNT